LHIDLFLRFEAYFAGMAQLELPIALVVASEVGLFLLEARPIKAQALFLGYLV
jgi:hypothetical protein